MSSFMLSGASDVIHDSVNMSTSRRRSAMSSRTSAAFFTAERTLTKPNPTDDDDGPGFGSTPATSSSETMTNDDTARSHAKRNAAGKQ